MSWQKTASRPLRRTIPILPGRRFVSIDGKPATSQSRLPIEPPSSGDISRGSRPYDVPPVISLPEALPRGQPGGSNQPRVDDWIEKLAESYIASQARNQSRNSNNPTNYTGSQRKWRSTSSYNNASDSKTQTYTKKTNAANNHVSKSAGKQKATVNTSERKSLAKGESTGKQRAIVKTSERKFLAKKESVGKQRATVKTSGGKFLAKGETAHKPSARPSAKPSSTRSLDSAKKQSTGRPSTENDGGATSIGMQTESVIEPSNSVHNSGKLQLPTHGTNLNIKEKNVEIDLVAVSSEKYGFKFSNYGSNDPSDPEREKRFNEAGIQLLSKSLHKQLFPKGASEPTIELVNLARGHLKAHSLLGKQTEKQQPINLDLPPLAGTSLDEHFYRLGTHVGEPYLTMAKDFANIETIPEMPSEWVENAGWTRYVAGEKPTQVSYPEDDCLVFDTEVLYKQSPFAVMATAVSKNAWYCWLSPWLLGIEENPRQLIPMGTHSAPKIIIGHNVGYDRVRVKDEYHFRMSKAMFLDTMSLHVAANGMCSQQRPTWLRLQKQKAVVKIADENALADAELDPSENVSDPGDDEDYEPWVRKSSFNSLADVAKFHCGIEVDKSDRDYFGILDREGVRDMLQQLITYCAKDVHTTFSVYKEVLPSFLKVCPHPVSFAALRHLASVFLPVDQTWNEYITQAEEKYQTSLKEVEKCMIDLIEETVALRNEPEKFQDDPWLKQLDWTIKPIRMTKAKKNEEPRMMKNQKMPGFPQWYKDMFPKASAPISVSVRTRIAPVIFRLAWDSNPLVWIDKYGWTFRANRTDKQKYLTKNYTLCDTSDVTKPFITEDVDGVYFKVPHKDGPEARCASPLAKGYLQYFESGILSSQYPSAREALEMNAACSYWISARERIRSQVPVWKEDTNLGIQHHKPSERGLGMILPTIVPMGTITRRAVEATWLTASNAKKNRVGSELKSMIRAPDNYKFVGADVDSEELWIASLVGDSQFKMHGGTAIGWMTLEGTKSAGTDLHSRTASILGISRNDAKVFNYGRIYGAGLKFAIQLLRQFNPSISEQDAIKTATRLYEATKGSKKTRGNGRFKRGAYWYGGTESLMFNKLEEIANQDVPRTPVLGCAITEALMKSNLDRSSFMTSRINWAIQSSGVDYLHLLIVSMDYLIERFKLDARLSITVHDEIRYLVKDKDKYKVAMALQISNLWTRAYFCEQMGIFDVPQSCAFFSAVDIDHVIRKEVDMPCVTPSHPNPIPPGETMTITQLLGTKSAKLKPKVEIDLSHIEYTPRTSVFAQMDLHQQLLVKQLKSSAPVPSSDLGFLSAQIEASGVPETKYR
ncbi:DNA polymerase family A-domain-containing protein [Myxozyma melibiosi]|uniref:DNA-directed DNA polymerase n=1 Tax=Myxozyma melibiosi TaxID=54550 RepID=A0ABR1F342_9ASCO